MGDLKALAPPICQEKVIGASGVELVPLGCFQVRVSFPLLLDWPPVTLTCCVYQNLSSDILMVSAYLKCVSLSHPLTVSQLPFGYLFNSTGFSQPSLTTKEAYDCNMLLARHVHTAKPNLPWRRYSNLRAIFAKKKDKKKVFFSKVCQTIENINYIFLWIYFFFLKHRPWIFCIFACYFCQKKREEKSFLFQGLSNDWKYKLYLLMNQLLKKKTQTSNFWHFCVLFLPKKKEEKSFIFQGLSNDWKYKLYLLMNLLFFF